MKYLLAIGLLCTALCRHAGAAPDPNVPNAPNGQNGLDLSQPKPAEPPPQHRGLTTTGTVLLATGVLVAGTSAGVFVYGAVNNLEASGCDTACGAVSGRVLQGSVAGMGVGLVLAVVGGILLLVKP